MILYKFARKVSGQLKKIKKRRAGIYLSPVRRIERIHPPVSGRVCAMTFDDGPTSYECTNTKEQLTLSILNSLAKYGAHATFDIIGTTANNYPDTEGALNNFSWSGEKYDHYPKFGEDEKAGAVNRPELVKAILDASNELANHGYVHRLFGQMRAVYGKRECFKTLDEVVSDQKALDSLIFEKFGYKMKLARPPHYIDKIPSGGSSYDAYRILGYNYLAASFDGGGWMPSGKSYAETVSAMTEPMKKLLEENPDALSGKIIFQKDGCNMSLDTPIADALPKQLKILSDFGYKVVSVSELLDYSPFEDLPDNIPQMPSIKKLLAAGHTLGYRNNTFQPERPVSADEFALMLCDPLPLRKAAALSYRDLVAAARENVTDVTGKGMLRGNDILNFAQKRGIEVDESLFRDKKTISRIDAVSVIAKTI